MAPRKSTKTGEAAVTIVKAVQAGRLAASSARGWMRRAMRGEVDIAVLDTLAPVLGPHVSAAEVDAAASAVAEELWFADDGVVAINDTEWLSMFPPSNPAELEHVRAAAREQYDQHAQDVSELSDDQLFDQMFAGTEPYGETATAGGPGHEAFTGQHSHQHPSYQDGDSGPAKHAHSHKHADDASHDHH